MFSRNFLTFRRYSIDNSEIRPMKRIVFFVLLAFCWASCAEEEQQEAGLRPDSPAEEETTVDTFSVKRPRPLTENEKRELDSTRAEMNETVNDAISIITEGSPDRNPAVPGANGIVMDPDVGPIFPGGQTAMDAWFKKKLIYPLVAFQNDIKGMVLLKVVIESDGKVGGITVMKSLGYGCDESAADCVRSMPNWIPAKKKGVPVRTAITLPVSFGNDIEK
jgi:protein TonB